MNVKVLIIDDEDVFREDLASLLRRKGFECKTAADGEEGLALAGEFEPDVVFCDIVMPGMDGIEVLDKLIPTSPQSSVVVITAYGNLETAVQAFRKGAFDYIMKPLVLEDVVQKINRIMENKRLVREVRQLRRELNQEADSLSMIGQSKAMTDLLELIDKVAPTKSTVLITGESGTGKELIARAIHNRSGSSHLPFVAINCAGIPDSLLESELFGHIKGSFTGAIKDKEGFFELAGEGTILLDEIGEMPINLQGKLLRVLEEREFFRVGSTERIPLKARLLASTNKDPDDAIKSGDLREDLFFRLSVFKMHLPPLRERLSDIPLLVENFVQKFNHELKKRITGTDNETMRCLMAYSWPGNIRELRNAMERAMILCDGECVLRENLSAEIIGTAASSGSTDKLRDAVNAYESEYIRRVITAAGNNKEEAARRLGINPSTLYRKMSELGIKTQNRR